MGKLIACAAALAAMLAWAAPIAKAAEAGKVSRLPALEEPPTDPINRKLFEDTKRRGGTVLNLHRTLGHAPLMAKAMRGMAYALRYDAVTPRLLREMTILRVGQLYGGEYETIQHAPLALKCGLTQAQIDDMPNWKASKLFDPRQHALMGYVDAVLDKRGAVDDATFDEFARFFSPREIVEITVLTGFYYNNILITNALRIEHDPPGAAPGKC